MELILQAIPVAEPEVEIVEHKGIGHPDTLCDALAERFSATLSAFYLERFGAILHHNVDKALLWGGVSRPRFGGGEVVAPMEIFPAKPRASPSLSTRSRPTPRAPGSGSTCTRSTPSAT
jgi:S-adenosylmethionine synthetase